MNTGKVVKQNAGIRCNKAVCKRKFYPKACISARRDDVTRIELCTLGFIFPPNVVFLCNTFYILQQRTHTYIDSVLFDFIQKMRLQFFKFKSCYKDPRLIYSVFRCLNTQFILFIHNQDCQHTRIKYIIAKTLGPSLTHCCYN